LDTARNSFDNSFSDETSPWIARNSVMWGFFLAGVVIGFVAVYLIVAQPVLAQLGQMQNQMTSLENDVLTLVGARHEAWQAGNLLADLTSLKSQLRDARATVREIRSLRQELLEESRHTAEAAEALRSLVRLQAVTLEQQDLASPATRSLEEMVEIQRRLIDEHESAPRAEETLTDLDRVRHDLSELLTIKSQLAGNGADVAAAQSNARDLLELKDQILAHGQDTAEAQTNAHRLFVLQEELKSQGAGTPDAFASLDRLLALKDKLVAETSLVADAVQNLEILSDFQDEFGEQIRSLARMREGLLQMVLMEGTVARVAKALEPLAQIANVRRLSNRELREAARSILESRSTQITSKPEAPRTLPSSTAGNPFDYAPDDSGAANSESEPRESELGTVPPPLPLPLSN
jgi:hypothetical protein